MPVYGNVNGLAIMAGNKLVDVDEMSDNLQESLEALRELYDWQNGPPLLTPKYEEGWTAAMQKAAHVLNKNNA